ncbi:MULTISPECIES: anti-sigma factor antagonist [unclassified Streptomyces]|uniref:anti-sigma factor antagonist n=1 Tax=unclassified Streptomyces TaxID=2593676 RepID=UPI00278C2322|nr:MULTISPECIES: anti-sigma factor antagonist [unclassified Streptomyces]
MLRSCHQGYAVGSFDETTTYDDEFPAPRLRAEGDCVVVELFGEIDILAFHHLAPLFDSLTSGPYRLVVADLTRTTFIDCSGLRLLVRAAHRARDRDGRVTVVCHERLTLRLIELGGLTRLLTPVETVEQAVCRDPDAPEDRGQPPVAG